MKTRSGTEDQGEHILHGLGVSQRVAIGPAFVIDQTGVPVPEYTLSPTQIDAELKRFQTAIAKTQKQLTQLRQKAETLPPDAAEEVTLLLEAYRGMLRGSRLVRGVEATIQHDRLNAEAAIQRQIAMIAESFAAMADVYLAARVADVRDVGVRLIRNLMQQQYNPFADVPDGCILVADEITPADTALMDPARVAGFAALLGGADCHAAIMARTLGLAAVLGAAEIIHGISTGDTLIVDGRDGTIIVRPTAATLAHYKQEMQKLAREARKLKMLRDIPAVTTDGAAVTLEANLELPQAIDQALAAGAVGVGLLRTEFLYMNRSSLPTEDEQAESLITLVQQSGGRPVTIRTLDVGGDKLAAALGSAGGESVNPALGLRAIRFGLKNPKVLETQLAAILRAAAFGPVRILVPMVSSVSQIVRVREHLFQVERRLRRRGVPLPESMPPVGAMIEIPGAALAADALTRVCDFFSIGSNDLIQYTLAIDRGDDRVADLYNAFHPAVLRLIQVTIAAGWRANIPVSLCGEMASDPAATALLMGLGLRDFSMAPAHIPAVKNVILNLSMTQAVAFADAIMNQPSEERIMALLDQGAGAFAVDDPPRRRSVKEK